MLFDADWYARISGQDRAKRAAVEDYLTEGRSEGLTPHPLFDPAYFSQQHANVIGNRDPLIFYLSDPKSRSASTHPLFDAQAYVATTPAASTHPLGPLGHYLEFGAAKGLAPNGWYSPDPQNEPNGLADWVTARADEWFARARAAAPTWQPEPSAGSTILVRDTSARFFPQSDKAGTVLVSVILLVGDDLSSLNGMVDSVRRQTFRQWELLVVHHREDAEVGALLEADSNDQRIRILRHGTAGIATALNSGVAAANGEFLAWLSAGDTWEPDHLRLALRALARPEVDAVHDVVELTSTIAGPGSPSGRDQDALQRTYLSLESSPERIAAGLHPELSALVVRRTLVVQVGAFDESLPAAAEHDFALRLAAQTTLSFIPTVGVRADSQRRERSIAVRPPRERPALDSSRLATWHDVVLNRHLVDWNALAERRVDARKVSIISAASHDAWRRTSGAVRSIAEAAASSDLAVQIIVVNNGCGLTDSVVLDSLPLQFDAVRIVTSAVDHGFALGSNIAMPVVEGSVVVFLHDDTEVRPGWLEPLVTALADPTVLGAQPLLVHPGGSIESAGVSFPTCGGLPHMLLRGFPVEDARGLATARFSAVTAAAMAVRFADVVALRGFDPLFRNGREDVDFCLRLKQSRSGSFTVQPRSIVVHHESQTLGQPESLINSRILLDRWGATMPRDDVKLWRHVGFDVVRHETTIHLSDDRRLTPPQPVLRRRHGTSLEEQRPVLRWAIKNPAPNDPSAEFWGDTHFARRLAAALRKLGQEVVIDHRPEFDRDSGRFDDVVLVLRGVAPYRPHYTQINLGWLISHPDMLRRDEASSYDRLFAASVPWADRMSKAWAIRIDPLLQATDPSLFHPNRARPDTGHPLLFVGSSRRKLRPIVRDAIDAGLPLSIFGREWKGLVPDWYVKAEYLPHEAVGKAYRAAGVVLNDHWDDMRVDGFLSNRLFDAAASGARIITDDVAGLGDLFGRSVQVARNKAELVELASAPDLDRLFGDDEERRNVAARIHSEHSFTARAQQLLDAALELRSQLSDARSDRPLARTGVNQP